jgi:hypothetical protein
MAPPPSHLPRGIRNNNPGNLRHGPSTWAGELQPGSDPMFVSFVTPAMGLRALMRLLLKYHQKYDLDSVESVLNRFAPPHENATDHYISAVCNDLRVRRKDKLKLEDKDTLIKLARAIARYENGPPPEGTDWYPDSIYEEAATLALKKESP